MQGAGMLSMERGRFASRADTLSCPAGSTGPIGGFGPEPSQTAFETCGATNKTPKRVHPSRRIINRPVAAGVLH